MAGGGRGSGNLEALLMEFEDSKNVVGVVHCLLLCDGAGLEERLPLAREAGEARLAAKVDVYLLLEVARRPDLDVSSLFTLLLS